jgi:hypothetical protein
VAVRVWVVLDQTEWARDVVGVFATREAAVQAIDRATSWEVTVEPWEVEGGEAPGGPASGHPGRRIRYI